MDFTILASEGEFPLSSSTLRWTLRRTRREEQFLAVWARPLERLPLPGRLALSSAHALRSLPAALAAPPVRRCRYREVFESFVCYSRSRKCEVFWSPCFSRNLWPLCLCSPCRQICSIAISSSCDQTMATVSSIPLLIVLVGLEDRMWDSGRIDFSSSLSCF